MSLSLSVYQNSSPHSKVNRNGLLIVAIAASVSLFATVSLLLYVAFLSIFSKRIPGSSWASIRLAFMQTSFGPIFINLVFADMLLAIGLMHNFITFSEKGNSPHSMTCTSQGVLIQLADVASSLLNLLIAVETFIILSNGPMLSWYTQFSTIAIWSLSCCFAALGFLSFSSLDLHPFYSWNGAWCWIGVDFLTYQITFHNVWIWLTAIGLVILYGILSWKIRTHYKGEGHILRRSSIVLPPSSPSSISTISASQSNLSTPSSATKRQRVGTRGLRVVARTMLLYPITFVAYSIPITILTLVENYQRTTSHPALIVALSTLFALRGAIDVLAFGLTRNVFILRTPPSSSSSSSSSSVDEESLNPDPIKKKPLHPHSSSYHLNHSNSNHFSNAPFDSFIHHHHHPSSHSNQPENKSYEKIEIY